MNEDFYTKRLLDAAAPVPPGTGASGYFSAPDPGLDPSLFTASGRLRPEVRERILDILGQFMGSRYREWERWTTVWIAGSGASHQWRADRGNGDLDILLGVNWTVFYWRNPTYGDLSLDEAANAITSDLRVHLWPKTAETRFGDRAYEMTFYVNPMGTNIADIGAYAAYDVTHDHWDITPPELPHDPATLYPATDWQGAEQDRRNAAALRDAYDYALSIAQRSQPGSPAWSTALADVRRSATAAGRLFDEIHEGRHAAFAPGGAGYSDPANFRWQAAKLHGVIGQLCAIKDTGSALDALHNPVQAAYPGADMLIHRALHHREPQ
jgi:hypothetical protein